MNDKNFDILEGDLVRVNDFFNSDRERQLGIVVTIPQHYWEPRRMNGKAKVILTNGEISWRLIAELTLISRKSELVVRGIVNN